MYVELLNCLLHWWPASRSFHAVDFFAPLRRMAVPLAQTSTNVAAQDLLCPISGIGCLASFGHKLLPLFTFIPEMLENHSVQSCFLSLRLERLLSLSQETLYKSLITIAITLSSIFGGLYDKSNMSCFLCVGLHPLQIQTLPAERADGIFSAFLKLILFRSVRWMYYCVYEILKRHSTRLQRHAHMHTYLQYNCTL